MTDEFTKDLPQVYKPDPAALAAAEAAKAKIQSAYLMALHNPRNVDQARDRILHNCRRPKFAEKVEFNKPVSGRSIKGPSIRFAEVALREWGNCHAEASVLYEDESMRRLKVFVTDFETNALFSKEIQIYKTVERKNAKGREVVKERINTSGEKVFIVVATEDELENKQNAMISKAIRNEGLRIIPADIIDEGIETARETLRKRDAEDPDAAKKKILDSFSEIGVRPKDLQEYLNHSTDSLTPSEFQDLRGIYRAIRDGESKWTDYVRPLDESTKDQMEGLKAKLDEKKGKIDKKKETPPKERGSSEPENPPKDIPPIREERESQPEEGSATQDLQNEREESEKSEKEGVDKIIRKFNRMNPEKLKEWAALVGNSFLKEMPEKARVAFDRKWDKFFGPEPEQEKAPGAPDIPKGTGETLNDGTPEILNINDLSRELTPDFDYYSMHLQRDVVDEWIEMVIKRGFGKDRDDILANFTPRSVYTNFKGWLIPAEEREGK